jgi:RNA-directed DNA polymerase
VEAAVWTERMLAALENGVKGGRWFGLIDKVWNAENLSVASRKVVANAGSVGVDGQTVTAHQQQREADLVELQRALREDDYEVLPARRVWIPKPGRAEQRPLGIPAVRDRVVQTALRHVIEPIFEQEFAEHSYGFRPKRGCKDALLRVQELLDGGSIFVVDADLKSYFDTIPHHRLMKHVEARIADGRVLSLITDYLKAGVLDTMNGWQPTERGTPQGAVISPLLANIYLNPLDHHMAALGFEMVRYADDFVVLCASREEAERALTVVQQWVAANGLTLHPDKTRVVDASQRGGFDFLGYHFERGDPSRTQDWPSRRSLGKFKDAVRAATRRTNGQSLATIVAVLNPKLRGWFAYFCHSHWTTFGGLDGWVRMRLRSVLRKRQKRRGRGRGTDQQRWPNAYFHALGLYSLELSHVRMRQSH